MDGISKDEVNKRISDFVDLVQFDIKPV
jgi:hypothetical protein